MSTVEDYKKQGYVVLRKIVDEQEATRLYDYTLKNIELGNKDDGQVPGSPSFYQDKEVVALQKRLLPHLEEAIHVKLLPIFCYHRIYRKDAILRVHRDSSRAEISASINVGQKGEPWDLWLLDYDENVHKVTLGPGDVLLYHGMKLWHWRAKLVNSDYVSQIMFHYVDKNGKNTFSAKAEIVLKIRQRCRKFFGIHY